MRFFKILCVFFAMVAFVVYAQDPGGPPGDLPSNVDDNPPAGPPKPDGENPGSQPGGDNPGPQPDDAKPGPNPDAANPDHTPDDAKPSSNPDDVKPNPEDVKPDETPAAPGTSDQTPDDTPVTSGPGVADSTDMDPSQFFERRQMNLRIPIVTTLETMDGANIQEVLQEILNKMKDARPGAATTTPGARKRRQAVHQKDDELLYFDNDLEESLLKAKAEALEQLKNHEDAGNVKAYYLRGNITATPLF